VNHLAFCCFVILLCYPFIKSPPSSSLLPSESRKSCAAPEPKSKFAVFMVLSLTVIDLSVEVLANIYCLLKKLVCSSAVTRLYFFSNVLDLFMYLSKIIKKMSAKRQTTMLPLKMLLFCGKSISISTAILPKYEKTKNRRTKSTTLVEA